MNPPPTPDDKITPLYGDDAINRFKQLTDEARTPDSDTTGHKLAMKGTQEHNHGLDAPSPDSSSQELRKIFKLDGNIIEVRFLTILGDENKVLAIPYHTFETTILALLSLEISKELELLMQIRSLEPGYEEFTERIKERLTHWRQK